MRRSDREITDINKIKEILDGGHVMHMAMVDSGKPYVVPLNYGYTLEDGRLTLYFHSAPVGRKMEILKENPSVFCEIDRELGLLGQGDDPCVYGYAFASVMGGGHASVLTDREEKVAALSLLMKQQTGRDDFQFTSDISKVSVVRIRLDSFSAKLNPLR